jgi:hypothetical protein
MALRKAIGEGVISPAPNLIETARAAKRLKSEEAAMQMQQLAQPPKKLKMAEPH